MLYRCCFQTAFADNAMRRSVTRSDKHLRKLFKKTKLRMVACKRQPNMPKELYPVYMYAFKKA